MRDVDIDTREAERMFDALDVKSMRKTLKSSVRRGALTVRRSVQSEVKSRFGTGRTGFVRAKGKGRLKAVNVRGILRVARPLYKDVKMFVYKKALGANVSILNGRYWNRAYILRFLNQGTDERKTDKGYRRGRLKGLHFFEPSAESGQKKADKELRADLDKAIIKAYLKYKKGGKA